MIRPGSTLPLRVAMTRPSSGVKPMVVSTLRPPCTAASEAPAPRWQVTSRSRGRVAVEQLGGSPGGVGVRQAVEAVPAQPESLRPRSREGVPGGGGGHPGVERGVEAGDGGGVRQCPAGGGDAGERARLVQRREVGQLADGVDDVVVDEHRRG